MTAGADGSTMVPVMQISPEGPAMIVTSQPAAVRAAAPDAHAPLRLPGRLRAAAGSRWPWAPSTPSARWPSASPSPTSSTSGRSAR